ncbi:hypothetical protein [Mesorhizobium sp.]|uniref:hypothetical protein n=1 Tax=Mesorhizobium sp. TaxID=1871066 RepID=UPI0012204996|nr:hypothetical protein [Mesorhizobium sp.]TIX28933.1 MAG: hypothetical protein E5V35_00815 [Mesorhizobium sp.]
MTIEQKIPQAVPVAQGQVTDGTIAINNRFSRAESAAFGFVDVEIVSTTETLTSAVFWEGSYLKLIGGSPGPTGAVTLNVPAEERGPFNVFNNCGQDVTVQVLGQSATPQTVANGEIGSFISDGINVRAAAGASGSPPTPPAAQFYHQVAISDENTDLTTGTAKLTFRWPVGFTLSSVRGSLNQGSDSGGQVEVDVKQSGASIFSTRPTFDATEKTTVTAVTPSILSTTAMVDDAEVTVDIVGAGIGAKGLKLTFRGVL